VTGIGERVINQTDAPKLEDPGSGRHKLLIDDREYVNESLDESKRNEMSEDHMLTLTAGIVSAHVSNNHISVADVVDLLERVYASLVRLKPPETVSGPAAKKRTMSERSSVKPEYIVCMECKARFKMIKRHLRTAHQLTPAEYREKFELSSDYPMVAPNYSAHRETLARNSGLGLRHRS
jgi:predicted transcriptional regulator